MGGFSGSLDYCALWIISERRHHLWVDGHRSEKHISALQRTEERAPDSLGTRPRSPCWARVLDGDIRAFLVAARGASPGHLLQVITSG